MSIVHVTLGITPFRKHMLMTVVISDLRKWHAWAKYKNFSKSKVITSLFGLSIKSKLQGTNLSHYRMAMIVEHMIARRVISSVSKRAMGSVSATGSEFYATNCKKIVGAALNYMDIVKERNVQAPKVPLLFLKPSTSLIQEGQDIVIPKVFEKVAFEVELGVVIGKLCKNVPKDRALEYVGGYCLALDMTAQCFLGEARSKGEPWTLGKGFDSSTPVSRLIKIEEIKQPHNVELWLKVNGKMKQRGNTADLIFNINDLIAYTSQYMTLEPNDIILTGTPKGAQAINNGDVIECGMGEFIKMSFKCKDE